MAALPPEADHVRTFSAITSYPAQPDNPLLHRDDVIVTPHIAAATQAGKDRLYEIAITQVLQLLRGERPANLINPEVWKD